ncbi:MULTISPECIES: hypothetical protein [Nostocales]|uniref:Uncharacterized protein n=3 Tax=Nostocales TaxID=1161 RepID=A0A0C1QMB3_9CYAN|nr:hypothetical protein [Tolypothrix bouteillei]KAF3889989.1 hypothetical protein DA73_0400034400 [Tolypothrix bouteillei VB521301]
MQANGERSLSIERFISREHIISKLPESARLLSADLVPFQVAVDKNLIFHSVLPREMIWYVKVLYYKNFGIQNKLPINVVQTLIYDAETGDLLCWQGTFERL